MKYEIGEIINYPVPGVAVGNCEENTINKDIRILNIYSSISDDGLIIDGEVLDGSITGVFSCKLLNSVNYKKN